MQGHELRDDERTSITSCDGVSCLLLQNISADASGKYEIYVKNAFGCDSHYAFISVEGKGQKEIILEIVRLGLEYFAKIVFLKYLVSHALVKNPGSVLN